MKTNDLYNAFEMPLSNNEDLREAQRKVLANIELNNKDKIILGRDKTVKQIGNYRLLEDHVYRLVDEETYNIYLKSGYILGHNKSDEYEEYEENGKTYNNNKGVDWFLGRASLKYGTILLECPAYKEYFTPSYDFGCHLAFDPYVRHMKSSGYKNPVPLELVNVINLKDENIMHNKR